MLKIKTKRLKQSENHVIGEVACPHCGEVFVATCSAVEIIGGPEDGLRKPDAIGAGYDCPGCNAMLLVSLDKTVRLLKAR